jgi:hypothetical protein
MYVIPRVFEYDLDREGVEVKTPNDSRNENVNIGEVPARIGGVTEDVDTTRDPDQRASTLAYAAAKKIKYPWEKWFDGTWRTAHRGVHYRCKTTSFRMYLLKVARWDGCVAQTRIHGDSVQFRVYDPAEFPDLAKLPGGTLPEPPA